MSNDSELSLTRLKWAAPLTVLLSGLVVWVLRIAALAVLKPSARFVPLVSPLGVFDAVVLSSAAMLVFVRFCRDNVHPIEDYRRLALRVLLVSFLPVILVAVRHAFGGGWREAAGLLAMHVAVWGICVTVPPAAVRVRMSSKVSADVRGNVPRA